MTDTRENIASQKRNPKGQVIGSTPTLPIMHDLDDALTSIRAKHAELGNVVLVVGTQGYSRRGQVHGHFAPNSWTSKNATHEIMLSGESLKRGAEATLATLLHECAHAIASAREIKDTSREGRYHSKRFKLIAEELGLDVDYNGTIGWSLTTLAKDTAKAYRTELAALKNSLKAYRLPSVKPSKPSKEMRVQCECRAVTIPIAFYNKGDFTCDVCETTFMPLNDDGWADENL